MCLFVECRLFCAFEKIRLVFISSFPRMLFSHLRIMSVVTPLAQRRQIQQTARFWTVVVHVSACQHDTRSGNRMRLMIFCTAPFAAIASPYKPDKPRAELPVCRVSRGVLFFYWHLQTPRFDKKHPDLCQCFWFHTWFRRRHITAFFIMMRLVSIWARTRIYWITLGNQRHAPPARLLFT